MTAPINTVLPAITGSVELGSTLTVDTGSWDNVPTSYTYQWLRDGVAISAALTNAHLVVRDDIGSTLAARVTATNVDGSASADSAATAALAGTLVVEDGSRVANAESYCTVAYADDYHGRRGNTSWTSKSTNEREAALRKATDFMTERYRSRWLGYRVALTQALDWPRYDVPIYDTTGGFRGYPAVYDYAIVPDQVKKACAELALRVASGTVLNPDTSPAVHSKSVGPISVVYEKGSDGTPTFKAVDELLRGMLVASNYARVVRA